MPVRAEHVRERRALSTARMMLVPGPASATATMSRFGLRRLRKLTGTGLAQPKTNGEPTQDEDQRQDDAAERVDVRDRVERQPPGAPRRVVAEPARHHAVRDLVQDDRDRIGGASSILSERSPRGNVAKSKAGHARSTDAFIRARAGARSGRPSCIDHAADEHSTDHLIPCPCPAPTRWTPHPRGWNFLCTSRRRSRATWV